MAACGFVEPRVPAAITGDAERRTWRAVHFWQSLPQADTAYLARTMVCDSVFTLYLSLLDSCHVGTQQRALRVFARALQQQPLVAYRMEQARHRTLNRAPFTARRDSLHRRLLRAWTQAGAGSPAMRRQWRYELRQLGLNDRRAADFGFLRPNGRHASLAAWAGRDTVLLLFFDPDCEACAQTFAVLEAEHAALLPHLRVLAVNVGDEHGPLLPPGAHRHPWLTAVRPDARFWTRAPYYLRRLPAAYVLAPTRRVLLKDADVEAVLSFFATAR